jgi:hypothetical protein
MSNIPKLPRYVALCGNPKSGKTEVQRILLENYTVQPVDDGFILRDIAMRHMGAKPADVETQEGKTGLAYWPNGDPVIDVRTGQHMTWRLILGRIQGGYFKQHGGLIIGLRNPLALPTGNAFDVFDESLVDVWIDNDAQFRGLDRTSGLKDLEAKVHQVVIDYSWAAAAA